MTEPALLTGRYVSLAGLLATAQYCPGEASVGTVFFASRTHGQPVGGRTSWYSGAGRDVNLEAATAAAVGEAFERYCLRDLDDTRFVLASARDLSRAGIPHVPAARLAPVLDPVPNEVGVPLVAPPGDHDPLLWMPSRELPTGDEVYLPAQYCVFLDHRSRWRDHVEQPWCMAISTGAATGPSPADACLSGLLEVLERDAFMLMWYHRLGFPRIRVPAGTPLSRRIGAIFGRSRIDVRFIDLTEVHDVPVVIAAARGTVNGTPVYAFGGGAALDQETAIWKAARELAGLYAWARADAAEAPPTPLRRTQVATYGDHVSYYSSPEHHAELSFVFARRPVVDLPPGRRRPGTREPAAATLDRLSRRLRDRGTAVYAVNLTPPDAEPFGFHTVKVVAPDLIPLDYNHQARHLNRERLLHEPTRRGWRPDTPTLADLNHSPHPFP